MRRSNPIGQALLVALTLLGPLALLPGTSSAEDPPGRFAVRAARLIDIESGLCVSQRLFKSLGPIENLTN